jgi:hypothetical protein
MPQNNTKNKLFSLDNGILSTRHYFQFQLPSCRRYLQTRCELCGIPYEIRIPAKQRSRRTCRRLTARQPDDPTNIKHAEPFDDFHQHLTAALSNKVAIIKAYRFNSNQGHSNAAIFSDMKRYCCLSLEQRKSIRVPHPRRWAPLQLL